MTPKEKAKELVDKYWYELQDVDHSLERAKQCALIAVDEMLKTNWINVWEKEYWQEVKLEIQAL